MNGPGCAARRRRYFRVPGGPFAARTRIVARAASRPRADAINSPEDS